MLTQSYVLIVDASEDCCVLLEKVFQKKCHLPTVGLYSGRQALELVAQREPLLIILDLRLPDITGSELVRILRQSPMGQSRILIGIATQTSEEARRLLKSGLLDAFLRKPLDLNRLTEIALRLLHQRQQP